MEYQRILLKLSGEALMGNLSYGIDQNRLNAYADDIKAVVEKGIQVGIVIGGGNIFRGLTGAAEGMDRVRGDYMGMLATIINSMALQSAIEEKGIKTRLLSGIEMPPIADAMGGHIAIDYLEKGDVVIIGGGTGNPYFTTDTASALRAVEIKADVLLKGTRVDGVYNADPEKDNNAVKYEKISFDEAYNKGLKIMDLTAFTLCKENKMPILVFDMNKKGNLEKVLSDQAIGTLVQ